jgi:hypothetical protein
LNGMEWTAMQWTRIEWGEIIWNEIKTRTSTWQEMKKVDLKNVNIARLKD